MKILWVCNMIPGAVRARQGGSADSGLWIDHVLADIRGQENTTLCVLYPGDTEQTFRLDEACQFASFAEQLPYRYQPSLEAFFQDRIRAFSPDTIHIWGTEYGHTLAALRAAESCGKLKNTVVSIQGLCSVYAGHFAEGVPERVVRGYSFRDLLRRDNIREQREKYRLRGELEKQALQLAPAVIGRTDWDEACTALIRPDRTYYFCNETLREPFYTGQWRYAACRKHRVFLSTCEYPVKGFHYMLEALHLLLQQYPDTVIAVTGDSFLGGSFSQKLRRQTYQYYLAELCRRYGLEDHLEFLGRLSAEQMKQAYLEANAFVLPSTIENSPNSLGEAMLLGVPCVAADVGGVTNMLREGEGYTYPSAAPYMLAFRLMAIFAMADRAEEMGQRAREHARRTHDPRRNLESLLTIYASAAEGGRA